jgi:predicted XRE-type DNA-binding protein
VNTKPKHTVGSGNVFADLELPGAEEALVKADLAHKILSLLRERRLTQAQAADILGIDQPKISALNCGRLSGFSIERLLRFLVLLGQDVKITVKSRPRSRSYAQMRVA